MRLRMLVRTVVFTALACLAATMTFAQDPTGSIEGTVTDKTGGVIPGAHITATHLESGLAKDTFAGPDGFYRFTLMKIGPYSVTVEAQQFGTVVQQPVQVNVSQAVRVNVELQLSSVNETVTVTGGGSVVDTSSNVLGRVVTGRELVDLPLNGRNFSQLGLLQTGVAPLTSGVAAAGGTLRQGQAYAVNGMRPEQNVYLVDGAQNMNRVDGGYALKVPVDAIAEFRILTQSAPAEYGGTGGATTSVVTKSGGNQYHGSVYEFVRNDSFDARNFFSEKVEPLKQHQFGATIGGPLKKEKIFYFGYYEGFHNDQGVTTTSTVPTPQQRTGDFSDLGKPLLNIAAGGVPFPGNKLPPQAINPVALNVVNLYPLGNVSPSIYRATVVGKNRLNQVGGRADVNLSSNDQIFGRYSYSGGYNINPVSVRGTDVPGYPTRDDINANSALVTSTHIFSPTLTNSLHATYLRYKFYFDQRLNRTPPSALGFAYPPSNDIGQGPPFFNVSGYTPIGGAITGPRNTTQNTFEVNDAITWTKGSHLFKFGAEIRHTGIDLFQAIAPNAFYVFAGTFPTNNAVANLLLGAPVTFYQGLGNFSRGLRLWNTAAYAQDEWRVTSRLTFNYGLRYERINPFTEIDDKLNAFVPGQQSTVDPTAPVGLLLPGDPGIAKGIARSFNAYEPRVGLAWDPTGNGKCSVRSSYGIYFDQFMNGSNGASQVPISSLPAAQFNQFSGQGLNFADPYSGHTYPAANTYVRPSTVFALDKDAKPPYSQTWNLSVQRSLGDKYLVEVRYVGAKGTHLPRNVEYNPAVYGPGATAQNADRRRIYANCPSNGGTCDFSTVGMLRNITNSTYEAAQASVSRRFSAGVGFNVSYWFSKSLDYLSALNLSGSAAKPLAGENDLAMNPFDLNLEHGPSLFDARHRFVASASWEPHIPDTWHGAAKAILGGWQLNGIAVHNSGTPFTVSDSTNVSLQANSPPISGFVASRPDLIGDPNDGPHTADAWISRDAFRRLNPLTEAGDFGDAGRNIARGPAFTNVDASLVRNFDFYGESRLQFRFEVFNVANHANLGLPVSDLNSANFGRILSAASPRLMQFALKLIF